jgi:hypothetical protein
LREFLVPATLKLTEGFGDLQQLAFEHRIVEMSQTSRWVDERAAQEWRGFQSGTLGPLSVTGPCSFRGIEKHDT